MHSPRAGFTLLQCLLVIVLIALVLGLTMSVVRGPLARRGAQTRVQDLAFSRDGQTLAAGSWNCTLRLWDMTTARERATYRSLGSFKSLAFSPDGRTLALGLWDGTVKLWDVAGEKVQAVFKGHSGPPIKREDGSLYLPNRAVQTLAFHPDGAILVTGSGDSTVKLLNVATSQEVGVFRGDTQVSRIALSGDGKRLATFSPATASSDNIVRLWNVDSGEEFAVSGEGLETFLALGTNSDGRLVAAGCMVDAAKVWRVKVWDVELGEVWKASKNKTHGGHLGAFSPDGKWLAVYNGNDPVRVWDVAAGEEVAILSGHTNHVFALAFSPDGNTLATGHDLGTVRLWDVATGRQRAILVGERNQVPWFLYGTGFLAWAIAWSRLKPRKPKLAPVDGMVQISVLHAEKQV